MSIFLQGLLLGFSAAIPLGPINIMIMTAALSSFLRAFAIGLGAMSADVLYLLLLSFGVLEYLQNELILKAIGIFGICYLFFISWLIFKGANNQIKLEKTLDKDKAQFAKNYFKGLFATLSNPYTIGFWLSVATIASSFAGYAWVMVAGLITAIGLWITLMPLAVFKSSKLISPRVIKYMSYSCAVILIGFAISLFYNIFFNLNI